MHWKGCEPLIVTTVSVSCSSLHTQDPLILPCTVLHANNRWLSLQRSVYLIKNHYAPGPLEPGLKWASACNSGRHQREIVTKESMKTWTWDLITSLLPTWISWHQITRKVSARVIHGVRSSHWPPSLLWSIQFVWKVVLVSSVVNF